MHQITIKKLTDGTIIILSITKEGSIVNSIHFSGCPIIFREGKIFSSEILPFLLRYVESNNTLHLREVIENKVITGRERKADQVIANLWLGGADDIRKVK